jgi:hypothetical protein
MMITTNMEGITVINENPGWEICLTKSSLSQKDTIL